MHIHILGIGGTFMGGVAVLAKSLGFDVSGSDENIYPPMSTQLETLGITLYQGYSPDNLHKKPDYIVIGNAMKRGNLELEHVLNSDLPYVSGPEWLAKNVLASRWVLAVSGTHGKTTTSSLLAWILEYAGKKPGFLIGGIPENFGVSARLSNSPYFVIEADEYDSAFFDKRSKFIHYHPKTLILNNLEFDHADIFKNLDEIKKQFHHLIRTIPSKGLIINNAQDENLTDVFTMGCWTPIENFLDSKAWHKKSIQKDGSQFSVLFNKTHHGDANWSLLGEHNMNNALAAIAAAQHAGVKPEVAIAALSEFKNVKRRLEIKGQFNGATVYDDFAHHPTAIQMTLAGLRQHIDAAPLIAVLEFGSYTMRTGTHTPESFLEPLSQADKIFLKASKENIDYAHQVASLLKKPTVVFEKTDALVEALKNTVSADDHVLVMSNTGFDGFFSKLDLE